MKTLFLIPAFVLTTQITMAKESYTNRKVSTPQQPRTQPKTPALDASKIQSTKPKTQIPKINTAALGQDRGGGDLCENRIQQIRDDMLSWIHDGGARALKLPVGLKEQQYEQRMTEALSSAKIICVKPGDAGHPVTIDGTPKVCNFDRRAGGLVTCDYFTFLDKNTTSESDQYILIHHEFAGIAGLENPVGDVSTYALSNQISGYLEDQVIKKLVVKHDVSPRVSEACEAFLYASVDKMLPEDQFISRMRMNPDHPRDLVDLEITLDMGNENYCIKGASAKVNDRHNGVCEIIEVDTHPDLHFDCG